LLKQRGHYKQKRRADAIQFRRVIVDLTRNIENDSINRMPKPKSTVVERPLHVLVGVTGSIAAYKSAELVRLLQSAGWEVTVLMTRAATEFIGELTFRTLTRKPVGLDMFGPREEWKPEHIAYAEQADLFVIAPCTANVMAKLAHGLADDLLSCSALACTAPLILAPAMNDHMWRHAATRANLRTLLQRGVRIVNPGNGDLACGRKGEGRMADPKVILNEIFRTAKSTRGKRTKS
jgi:phosphopantothenoylcysteine decarboxylase/phosphopantothenate--cysteine ligase